VKLTEIIAKKAILLTLKSKDKKGAVTELVQQMRKAYEGEKFVVADIVDAVMQREKLGSTGVGGGVAVPHAKLEGVKGVLGAFGRCGVGLDFNAVDGESVHLVFVILSPPQKNETYLQALQKVMGAIKRPNFVKFLKGAKTVRDIEDIFRELEEVAPV
jgi:mannitol/fructose-specific phosphotransferase system IIA component (Ntr-type)